MRYVARTLDIETIRKRLSDISNARVTFDPAQPPSGTLWGRAHSGVRTVIWPNPGTIPVIGVGDRAIRIAQDHAELAGLFSALDRRVDRQDDDANGSATVDSLRNRGAARGIDALAWYASFHNRSTDWGIYIPVTSVFHIADRWLNGSRAALRWKLEIAFSVLHRHELFHFAADYAVAQWELLLQSPCWAAFASKLASTGTYLDHEEMIANAYMLRSLRETVRPSACDRIGEATRRQPPGYCDAESCIEDEPYSAALAELIKLKVGLFAIDRGVDLASDAVDLEASFPLVPQIDPSRCPVHVIHNEGLFGLPPIDVAIIDRIPEIEETPAFQKGLRRAPGHIRERWIRKKRQLAERVPGHPEFECLKGRYSGMFSIRVGHNYRAHLRPGDGGRPWQAVAIGPHTAMGHG